MRNGPRRILVVDDEIHILHVIGYKLRQAGYEVLTARDGPEALEMAQVELPDLVITDYHMPRLSGLELSQRLRHLPATRDIPVILLTARGYALEAGALEAAGIDRCMHKPFGPRRLLGLVNEMLAPLAV